MSVYGSPMKLNLTSLIVAFVMGTFLAFGDGLPAVTAKSAGPSIVPEQILIEAVIFDVTSNAPNDAQRICFGNSDAPSEVPVAHAENAASVARTRLGASEGDFDL